MSLDVEIVRAAVRALAYRAAHGIPPWVALLILAIILAVALRRR